jgi:hypothetical protein
MRTNNRKGFVTKLYRFYYNVLYDPKTLTEVDIDLNEAIYADCYVWITTYNGKTIRQAFVDKNNRQFRC